MILNLLRVEKLRVEDMMKRSFKEINSQKKAATIKERLEVVRKQVESLPKLQGAIYEQLELFYSLATQYLEAKEKYWTLVLSHPTSVKLLAPGRVVVVRHGRELLQFGVLLAVDNKSREKIYSVLVVSLDDDSASSNGRQLHEGEKDEKFLQYLSLGSRVSQFFGGTARHEVVQLEDKGILEITARSVKADCDKILADVKKREMPRFRDDPPGQTTSFAVQELVKVIDQAGQGNVEYVSLAKDLKVHDIDQQTTLKQMESTREAIQCLDCHSVPDFREQLYKVYRNMSLVQEVKDLEYLASEDSLEHLPEYHRHIEVLRHLSYIDDNNTVRLKGRVACEMGSQELIITELVLDNVLTDLPPAEIAALLSCMVFQHKKSSEPELTERLEAGVKKIKECAQMIGQCQKDCGMEQAPQDYVEQFNHGLVQVVYEWARGMPFSEITQLTDVQGTTLVVGCRPVGVDLLYFFQRV
jgi:antiviral helicase SKI2